MAQLSAIIILDEERGRPVGTQLKAMLQHEFGYRIDLAGGPGTKTQEGLTTRPELIIPVLPKAKEPAQRLLMELRAADIGTSLLPVFRLEAVRDLFDDLRLWTGDFLLTPLRDGEVRVRVQRLISKNLPPDNSSPTDAATEAVALGHLVGQDLTIVDLKRKLLLAAQVESRYHGQTGTEEMCSNHYLSGGMKPFLPINWRSHSSRTVRVKSMVTERGIYGSRCRSAGLVATKGGTLSG